MRYEKNENPRTVKADWSKFEKTVYTLERNDGKTIMVLPEVDSWEIYYKKPGSAYEFAFGLSKNELLSSVFCIALTNIDDYNDLFDE